MSNNNKTSVSIGLNGNKTNITVCNIDDTSNILKMGKCELVNGEIMGVGTFPPKMVNMDTPLEKRIKDTVFRCTNFTSKYIGVCELTGEKCKLDDTDCEGDVGNKLINKKLKGCDCFVNFPGGIIQYFEKNQSLMDMANIYYETDKNIIVNFDFNNKLFDQITELDTKNFLHLNVKRSSGEIDTNGILYRTMPIRYSNSHNKLGINIRVKLKDDDDYGEKFVLLTKILNYNPELFPIKVGLDLDVIGWLKDDRIKWREKMIKLLTEDIGKENYIIDDSLSVYE